MNVKLSKRAKEIIATIQYATIASVDEKGMPWNAPVFTAYDDKFNFYWGTHNESQKAKNIHINDNVFLVIYDSTVHSGTGEGVYIRAAAEELSDKDEIETAIELLTKRHREPFWDSSAFGENGSIRVYEATPLQAWMNGGDRKNGHYIDIRTEIKL